MAFLGKWSCENRDTKSGQYLKLLKEHFIITTKYIKDTVLAKLRVRPSAIFDKRVWKIL